MPSSISSATQNAALGCFAVATIATTAAATVAAYQYWTRRNIMPMEIQKSPYALHVRTAIRLARQAGRNMRSHYDRKGSVSDDLGVNEKSSAVDFSTQIDIDNEELIIHGLHRVFPSHQIIGEESVGTGSLPELTKEPTWILDPIDGTTNFASGLPLTCVSIGFCVGGRPVVGVVYAPMTEEWYVAVSGFGSFRNGVRINSSSNDNSSKKLCESVVCFEAGYARANKDVDKEVEVLRRLGYNGYRGLKTIGSGVLDLCYVASGRLDVVYAGVNEASGWKPWDYCAGMVIVEEAGGVIEPIDDSKKFTVYSKSVISATSKALADEMRALILQ